MFHWVMSASLQYIIEAYHVALDVGIRISDAIAHTSLSCEIYHYVKVVLLEQLINQRIVSQVALYELIFNSRRLSLPLNKRSTKLGLCVPFPNCI